MRPSGQLRQDFRGHIYVCQLRVERFLLMTFNILLRTKKINKKIGIYQMCSHTHISQ